MRRITTLLLVSAATGAAVALLPAPRSPEVAAQVGLEDLDAKEILFEIDGVPVATGVVAVSGLAFENNITAVRDGTGTIIGEVVGSTSPVEPTFVLAPGPLADNLWEWYAEVRAGRGSSRNMSVVFLDSRGEEVFRYGLRRGLPKSWRGFRQVAPGAVVAREEVTFHCRSITRG